MPNQAVGVFTSPDCCSIRDHVSLQVFAASSHGSTPLLLGLSHVQIVGLFVDSWGSSFCAASPQGA